MWRCGWNVSDRANENHGAKIYKLSLFVKFYHDNFQKKLFCAVHILIYYIK